MKKIIKIILILGSLFLLYKLIIMCFINKHNKGYSITTKNNKYEIVEEYENDYYLFSIKDKKNKEFVYRYQQDLNNEDKIITDILSYKNGDLYCIAPVMKEKIENIVCRLDNQLVSYQYLKQIEDHRVDTFIQQIKKSSYLNNLEWTKDNQSVQEKYNLTIYNHISKDVYITMWNYSRLFIINNQEIKKVDLLKKDAYENNFSILVDKYYVVTNTDFPYYNHYYLINIEKGKKEEIQTKDEVSKKIYFNGIYKNNLYITDKENEKQYIINPKRKSIEETPPKYYNGEELIDENIHNLVIKNTYFSLNQKEKTFQKKYNHYTEENGNVYQKIKNQKVLLFHFDNFRELKIVEDTVFGINDDTLYMYNNQIGLKKVVTNRELIYNDKNIYDVYKK